MATPKGSDTGGAAPVGELSYSDAGAELDEIIGEFETGVVDVDRLVDQLERATEIVDELDRRLRRTRMGWRSSCRGSKPSVRRAGATTMRTRGTPSRTTPLLIDTGAPGMIRAHRAVSRCCAPGPPSRGRATRASRTFPDGLRGRASTKSIDVGHL